MILPQLHALESSSTANQFMAELGLVLVAALAVDLLVGVFGVVCGENVSWAFITGTGKGIER